MKNFFKQAWSLYYDGFRNMTLGKTLWAIIIIKLVVMFLILKPLFFTPTFKGLSDEEKASRVSYEIINR